MYQNGSQNGNQRRKYNNSTKTKGYITDYKIEEELIKNDYVGQKDFYYHIISVKTIDGIESEHLLKQMNNEKCFEKGTYVSFNHYPTKEASLKGLTSMESKSFVKTYTPEELQAFSSKSQEEKKQEQEQESTIKIKNQSSSRRSFR